MPENPHLPAPTAANWDWQLRGACRNVTGDLFFHPPGERGTARAKRSDYAKMVCRACPVVQACRRYALAAAEPYGVWGGLSEEDCAALRNSAARRGPGLREVSGCGRVGRREDDRRRTA